MGVFFMKTKTKILVFALLLILGAKLIGQEDHGIQRESNRPLQQSQERGKFSQERSQSWDRYSRSPRMWGRNETPNQGVQKRDYKRSPFQNLRLRLGNSVVKSRYGMVKRKNLGRSWSHKKHGNSKGAKSPPRQDTLLRPSGRRNTCSNPRLSGKGR